MHTSLIMDELLHKEKDIKSGSDLQLNQYYFNHIVASHL